jgi:hypothetical protein
LVLAGISTWWGAGGIARERYLKIVETVDIDRRLRELERKSAIQK